MDSFINLRRITLYVGVDANIPEELSELTPEETELMLSVGCNALYSAKKGVSTVTNREMLIIAEKEMGEKYENEIRCIKEKADNAERCVALHKEMLKIVQEEKEEQIQIRVKQSREIFDGMLNEYRKDREMMRNKVVELEKENENIQRISREIKSEMEKTAKKDALYLVKGELDSMRQILKEKDRQNEGYKEMFERSISKVDILTQKRDVASIGKIGEGQFKGLAQNVFRDFDGFQLTDVHSIGGLGDFHLQFKEMTILVDSKLYSNKVNSTSREKIKRDLINNEHIQFAWLVSMDTYVERYDKAPFMFEWVNSNKCVCYINCLQKQEEPGEVLRSVWYCCNAMRKMMTTEGKEHEELSIFREREMKVREILSKLVKSNRERDTILNQLRLNLDKSDEYIREMLTEETNALVKDYYRIVSEWWNKNLEDTHSLEKIKSTVIWTQFKRDMDDSMGEIDCTTFKHILCSFLGEDKVVKSKTKTGALEICGVKWRDDSLRGPKGCAP
jgi:hypothetical protein